MDQRTLVERAQEGDRDAFGTGSPTERPRRAWTRPPDLILRDRELARDRSRRHSIRAWRDLPGLRDPEQVRRLALPTPLPTQAMKEARRRRRRVVGSPLDGIEVPRRRGLDFQPGLVADRDAARSGARGGSSRGAPEGPHRPALLPRPAASESGSGDGHLARGGRVPASSPRSCRHPALRSTVESGDAPTRHGDGRPGHDRLLDRASIACLEGRARRPGPSLPTPNTSTTSWPRRRTEGHSDPAWTFPERWLPMGTATRNRSIRARPALAQPRTSWRCSRCSPAAILAVAIGTQRRLAPPYGPADNGLIVYQQGGDLYARDVVDGQGRVLIGGVSTDVFPFFSLDGSRLAFLRLDPTTKRERPTSSRRWSWRTPDGTGQRMVFGPSLLHDVAWSPNGHGAGDPGRGGRQAGGSRSCTSTVRAARVIHVRRQDRRAGSPGGRPMAPSWWSSPRVNSVHQLLRDRRRRGSGPSTDHRQPELSDRTNSISVAPDGRVLTYMNMAWPYSLHLVDLHDRGTSEAVRPGTFRHSDLADVHAGGPAGVGRWDQARLRTVLGRS